MAWPRPARPTRPLTMAHRCSNRQACTPGSAGGGSGASGSSECITPPTRCAICVGGVVVAAGWVGGASAWVDGWVCVRGGEQQQRATAAVGDSAPGNELLLLLSRWRLPRAPKSNTVHAGATQVPRRCHAGATQVPRTCVYSPPSHWHSSVHCPPSASMGGTSSSSRIHTPCLTSSCEERGGGGRRWVRTCACAIVCVRGWQGGVPASLHTH